MCLFEVYGKWLVRTNIAIMYVYTDVCNARLAPIVELTCAPMISWVRAPPLVCSTHCCHPPSWDKHWIASEEYLSTLSCVLIWINRAVHRRSGITTVDWREKIIAHECVESQYSHARKFDEQLRREMFLE